MIYIPIYITTLIIGRKNIMQDKIRLIIIHLETKKHPHPSIRSADENILKDIVWLIYI